MDNNQHSNHTNIRMGMVLAVVSLMAFLCVIDDDDENNDESANTLLLIENFSSFVQQTVAYVLESINDDSNNTAIQQPKRRRKSKFDWERARAAVIQDWVGPDPIFDDKQFERVYRITRPVMERIRLICGNMDDFFTEKISVVTMKRTICPTSKILLGLKLLAYGVSASAFQDYFQMGLSTCRECLLRLAACLTTNEELVQQFFRPMSRCDAQNVSELHKKVHGIEGMAGSLDCMHVTWKNCPVAWQGHYEGKEDGCTLVLEAMCDYNLYFWHHQFGFAGTMNDINIWDVSGLHQCFVNGSWAQNVDFEFEVNDQKFNKLWVTVDGIYPEIARFVKTLSCPINNKEKQYAKWQEHTRKDVERGFGVLQRKFHFLVHKVELWKLPDIVSVVNCCILLHNWMVSVRVSRDETESIEWYEEVQQEVAAATAIIAAETEAVDVVADTDALAAAATDTDALAAASANDTDALATAAANTATGPCTRAHQIYLERRKEILPLQYQLVQERWMDLYDTDNFHELQMAIMNQLEKNQYDMDNNND